MKKIFIIFAFLLLSVSCNKKPSVNIPTPPPTHNYVQKLLVGNSELFVELPKTSEEFQLGLSNRTSMEESNGMLFDFGNTPVKPSFWMKDMLFSLDIIWIKQNKIIGITENIPVPCNSSHASCYLPTYSPPSAINQVLEVNAGWSKRNNIKVGDEVKLIDQN